MNYSRFMGFLRNFDDSLGCMAVWLMGNYSVFWGAFLISCGILCNGFRSSHYVAAEKKNRG